jgi:4-hydroxy-3-methylbut-2-enyl diphosphate reductase
MMIVVGGKNSANTTRLYQICKKIKPSYHIESADEIQKKWLRGVKSVGITAGASTPKDQLKRIYRFLKQLK